MEKHALTRKTRPRGRKQGPEQARFPGNDMVNFLPGPNFAFRADRMQRLEPATGS